MKNKNISNKIGFFYETVKPGAEVPLNMPLNPLSQATFANQTIAVYIISKTCVSVSEAANLFYTQSARLHYHVWHQHLFERNAAVLKGVAVVLYVVIVVVRIGEEIVFHAHYV